MAGVLTFTLGLQVNEFLKNIGISAEKVLGFVSVGKLMEKAFEGAFSKIEQGAALKDLSKRSGESVANLYMLQQGFQAAGLASEEVGGMLLQMQKALGGVNEMGESTADVFHRLGLSAEQLKGKGGAEAVKEILGSIGKLNQSEGVKAASMIFGRMGAGNAMQLSRSMGEFADGMERSKKQAYVFEKMAGTFDSIERGLQRVKQMFGPIYLSLAEGFAPEIKAIVDYINSIDLSKIAAGIKQGISTIREIIKEGKLYEFLSMTFAAAVEFYGNMLYNVIGSKELWSGIWHEMVGEFQIKVAVIGKMLLGLGTILTASFDMAFQKLYESIGKVPHLGKALGLEGYTASSFAENYKLRREEGKKAQDWLNGWVVNGARHLGMAQAAWQKAMRDAIANSDGPAQQALRAFWGSMAGKQTLQETQKQKAEGGSASFEAAQSGKGYKPDFTSLEKMGLVIRNLGNPMMAVDHARVTAENTRRLVELATRQEAELVRLSLRIATSVTPGAHAPI